MAVDTRDKRASASSLHFIVWNPLADNSINQGDRQQVQGIYRGIEAAELNILVPWHLFFQTETF